MNAASHHHWRLLLAALCGLVTFTAARIQHTPFGLSSLVGWNVTSAVFLGLTVSLMLYNDGAAVRARASLNDEGAPVITAIVLSAVAASLAATFLALSESKGASAKGLSGNHWPIVLSVSTLVLSWLVIQTLFTLRYAHWYFGDEDKNGEINGGVEFPGEQPRDYRDFVYIAVCIGCTSQVSDFNILTAKFRSLVTTHAVVAFSFNVSILALGINMVASTLGQ